MGHLGHDPAHGGGDTSRLLARWQQGEREALAGLIPRFYAELRTLARGYLRRERADHTLETSALVHEAYLRLIGQRAVDCRHRRQFFAVVATTMRRVLVDSARARRSLKRGSNARRSTVEQSAPALAGAGGDLDVLALGEALASLRRVAPEQARVVELRVFAGLSAEEVAGLLGLSVPTVTRRWRAARAWLYRFLTAGRSHG